MSGPTLTLEAAKAKPIGIDRGIYEKTTINKLARNSPWLKDTLDKLLFEHIQDAIKPVQSRYPDPDINPYLYENLMADVSRLLDRCLAYRRECADLERQAVSRALDYDLFGNISANDEDLNRLLTDTSPLTEIQRGQQATAAELAKLATTDSLKSLKSAYDGGAAAATDTISERANGPQSACRARKDFSISL